MNNYIVKKADESFEVFYNSRMDKSHRKKFAAASAPVIKEWIRQKIKFGYSDEDIVAIICNRWGFDEAKTRAYLVNAREVVHQDYINYTSNILEKNVTSLIAIKEYAFNSGKVNVALDAIKELNKLYGLQDNAVNINLIDNKPVKIKFE